LKLIKKRSLVLLFSTKRKAPLSFLENTVALCVNDSQVRAEIIAMDLGSSSTSKFVGPPNVVMNVTKKIL